MFRRVPHIKTARQCTATRCNTLQHTVTPRKTRQRTAAHSVFCSVLQCVGEFFKPRQKLLDTLYFTSLCNWLCNSHMLQHTHAATPTYCSTPLLQHTLDTWHWCSGELPQTRYNTLTATATHAYLIFTIIFKCHTHTATHALQRTHCNTHYHTHTVVAAGRLLQCVRGYLIFTIISECHISHLMSSHKWNM